MLHKHEAGPIFGSRRNYARKKTAGYHFFRNVLPKYNLGPRSWLTAGQPASEWGRWLAEIAPSVARGALIYPRIHTGQHFESTSADTNQFELVINAQTVRMRRPTLPPALLASADGMTE